MQYTEFSFTEQGDLRIDLTPEGKTKLENLLMDHANWNDDEILLELIDEYLMKGWRLIPPDQIRAMRNLLILSNHVQYDGEGNVTRIDDAYWHPNNQLGIVSKILLQNGFVIFEKGQQDKYI
jgi:hypothetical protein